MLEQRGELLLGEHQVESLAISAKNGQVALGSDGGVKLCAASAEAITALSDDKNDLPAAEGDEAGAETQVVCFSPGGKVLAVGGSEGGTVGVYDFPSLKRFAKLDTGLKGVRCLALSTAGASQLLAICGRDGSCSVWQVGFAEKEPTRVATLSVPDAGAAKPEFRSVAFLEACGSLVTGANLTEGRGRKMKVQATLLRWSARSWTVEASARVLKGCGLTAMGLCSAADMVGIGGSDGSVGVFSATTLARVFTATPQSMAVTCVAIIPARGEGQAPQHASKESKEGGPWAAHPPLLVSVFLNNVVLATPVVPMSLGERAREQAPLIVALLVLLSVPNAAASCQHRPYRRLTVAAVVVDTGWRCSLCFGDNQSIQNCYHHYYDYGRRDRSRHSWT